MPRVLVLILLAASPLAAQQVQPLVFEVTLQKSVAPDPCTGRLFVLLASGSAREPRLGPNWFKPEPFFAIDVKDWKPGTTRTIGPDALAYPVPVAKIRKGSWNIQAVLDLDRGGRHFGASPGNLFSKASSQELDPAATGKVSLSLDQVVKEREFRETERVKLVDIQSKLLSEFHNKPIRLRAGVVLPKSYRDSPQKKYPIIYEVPGFSGTHHLAFARAMGNATDVDGVEFLHVMLDPDCRTGHHVFADSANNGPYGEALVKELIPHIEKTFRAIGKVETRFVTGHSSGGWSSLWLQVTYPDFFGGVWSTAPDPIDFRDFQKIHLYRPGEKMFTDAEGKPRPIARSGGKPVLYYQGFSDMEEVMGRGGQLASFEAVFSPRGSDGQPRKLWDRRTGAIDLEVARSWEKYDINLVLERNWNVLGPKLAGKIHIYMGSEDTFYLEGATLLVKETLKKLKSDAKVEIFPGKDHGTILSRELQKRMAREMAEKVRRSQS